MKTVFIVTPAAAKVYLSAVGRPGKAKAKKSKQTRTVVRPRAAKRNPENIARRPK